MPSIPGETPSPRASTTPAPAGSPSSTPAPTADPTATPTPLTPTPGPTTGPNTQPLVVSNPGAGDVLTFGATASGDAVPQSSIGGSNTTLSSPLGLALQSGGTTYVANQGSSSVLIFSSSGNVAPSQTITDSNPGVALYGLTFDRSATYALYVSSKTTREIDMYGKTGALQGSIAGSITTLAAPTAMVSDNLGTLYVVDGAAIKMFSNAARGGNNAPAAVIAGSSTTLNAPDAISLDSHGDILVADGAAVKIFTPGSSGNVAPAVVITGPDTGLQQAGGIDVDGGGGIWVADSRANAIYRFARDANGDAAPIVTIQGPDTQLSGPASIQLGTGI